MKKIFTFLVVTVLTIPVFSQQKIFLNAGTNIQGESSNGVGDIDAYAYSGGMSQSGTTHIGTGGGAGKASFTDLIFTLCLDKSTPAFMIALAKGTHIPTVKAVFKKLVAGNYVIYSKIEMTEVLVSAINEGAITDTNKTTLNISFNYAKIRYTYYNIDSTGALIGSAYTFGWNVADNVILP